MTLRTKQFQPLTDVGMVWDFMTDVYTHDRVNGVPAPFFEYALSSSWLDKHYLYMDRLWLDGDDVVAFAFYEEPCTDVYVCLCPGYEALADEIVEYGEMSMPRFDGEKAFVLFSGQRALIDAVRRRGFAPDHEETEWVFDFSAGVLDRPLPEGFHFVDPLKCDPLKLTLCFWKGFGHAERAPFERWTDPGDGRGMGAAGLLLRCAGRVPRAAAPRHLCAQRRHRRRRRGICVFLRHVVGGEEQAGLHGAPLHHPGIPQQGPCRGGTVGARSTAEAAGRGSHDRRQQSVLSEARFRRSHPQTVLETISGEALSLRRTA